MELTRRDALVAAAGGGVGLSGGALLAAARSGSRDGRSVSASTSTSASTSAPEAVAETTNGTQGSVQGILVAVARAIYPSAVSEIEPFVRTYLRTRFGTEQTDGTDGGDGVEGANGADREDRRAAITAAVQDLDGLAKGWYGASIATLDSGTVEELLRDVGVDTAAADPSGTLAQRVRFYVVNELQYALFASPTGGSLVGIENPIGYPGGAESYQQGPSA